ncbi:MAG: hypothetical protein EBT07_10460 [Actinobacteria bacterium]|nr:hypothetical protein [Actinomycetota bacterium]
MSLEDDLLNIKQASKLTGLSEMTIRKYLGITKPPRPSKLPNARKVKKDGVEIWEIPVSDLFNAGLMRKVSSSNASPVEPATEAKDTSGQLVALQAENLSLKKQIELLEANLADLRLMFRSIETAEAQEARKKRFWQR